MREEISDFGGLRLANLVFHLVHILFGFLIFDAPFFYLIGELGDGKAGINPPRVLQ